MYTGSICGSCNFIDLWDGECLSSEPEYFFLKVPPTNTIQIYSGNYELKGLERGNIRILKEIFTSANTIGWLFENDILIFAGKTNIPQVTLKMSLKFSATRALFSSEFSLSLFNIA